MSGKINLTNKTSLRFDESHQKPGTPASCQKILANVFDIHFLGF